MASKLRDKNANEEQSSIQENEVASSSVVAKKRKNKMMTENDDASLKWRSDIDIPERRLVFSIILDILERKAPKFNSK